MSLALRRPPSRGAVALVVVMVLFLVMMLAAGFNNRSLLFEQKTSANQYRYTRAFEAAEAGLQWALALLNGGHVDGACEPTSEPAALTFRERYLRADIAAGRFELRAEALGTACVKASTGWLCSCPSTGEPLIVQPGGTLHQPTFSVRLQDSSQPGTILVQAKGCSNFGTQCTGAASQRSDAFVQLESLLALSAGLRQHPTAALTAGGSVAIEGAGFRFTNSNAESVGVAVMAGGAIASAAGVNGTPGSLASDALVAEDGSLARLGDRFFANFFGLNPQAFRRLPTVRRIACDGNCTAAVFAGYHAGYRAFWLDGSLSMGAAVLGSAEDPVLLVVDGNVQLGAARIWGAVYATAGEWNNGDSTALLHGAAIAQGDFRGGGSPHFVYDPDILTRLHMRVAPFARVPGSWSDLQ